jgi:hypothetical protein
LTTTSNTVGYIASVQLLIRRLPDLHLVRALSAFTVRAAPESGDKLTRFGPFSSQCRAGNVKIRRGSWNEELFRVLEGFPDLAHDDEVDGCSGALEMLNHKSGSHATRRWRKADSNFWSHVSARAALSPFAIPRPG